MWQANVRRRSGPALIRIVMMVGAVLLLARGGGGALADQDQRGPGGRLASKLPSPPSPSQLLRRPAKSSWPGLGQGREGGGGFRMWAGAGAGAGGREHGGEVGGGRDDPRLLPSSVPRLRGGMPLPSTGMGNVPFLVKEEEVNAIEALRNSFDPGQYPPMEPQFDEEGFMIYPEPEPLSVFGDVKRLLDDSGRLITTRQADRKGVSQFYRPPKGKNSLRLRCTCGNKIPCHGDVMITKNEHGKLEYNKIPRSSIGPAHPWECKQPAQYMVTPTDANLTEIFGGMSPLMRMYFAEQEGMPLDEVERMADPAMVNESEAWHCHLCESDSHRWRQCPFLYDLTDDQRLALRMEKECLQRTLNEKTVTLTDDEEEKMQERLKDIDLQVTYNRIYAPVDITKGNTTVRYNQPGVNWGEGECSMRDVIEVDEGVLPTCPGDEIQYPACGLYDTVRLAVRAAVDGQTVVVAGGQHAWFGVCHIISDSLMRKRLVKIRGAGRGGFEHEMSSKGRDDDADQDEVEEWGVQVQSPTLLHGRLLLRQDTYGEVVNCAFYTRHGGMPGHHAVLRFHPHEEEQEEVFKRFRPKSFTEMCIICLGGPWSFEACDVVTNDATCVVLSNVANVSFSSCSIGSAGQHVPFTDEDGEHGLELDGGFGYAYVGIEMEGGAICSMRDSKVRLTQVCGVRMADITSLKMDGCHLEDNGVWGGSGVALSFDAAAVLTSCSVSCPRSFSPLYNRTSAFEASVSSRTDGRLLLKDIQVTGMPRWSSMWMGRHRPAWLDYENVTYENVIEAAPWGAERGGKQQAIEDGMPDPVLLWKDSRYEIWWPKERMTRLGYVPSDAPVDGIGEERHVEEDDPYLESDEEEGIVWVNSSKKIPLEEWGWDGTLEDAYDTSPNQLKGETGWPLREEVSMQLEVKLERDFRRGRRADVEPRAELIANLVELATGKGTVKHRKALIKTVQKHVVKGDLAIHFWLQKVASRDPDQGVRTAAAVLVGEARVTNEDVEMLRSGVENATLDSSGRAPGYEINVNGGQLLLDQVPNWVKTALWPRWPLYPQLTQGEWEREPQPENPPGRKFPVTQSDKDIQLDDTEQVKREMSYFERVALAKAGMAAYPTEEEAYNEIKERRVDDWFRVMSEKEHEAQSLPILRDYAKAFGLEPDKTLKDARDKRIKLQKVKKLTDDYALALNMSTQLHLVEDEWRDLFPLFDPSKLFNPPTYEKLERLRQRVEKVNRLLNKAMDEERFLYMELVYPLAKRVERAFDANNNTEIEAIKSMRRRPYTTAGKVADGVIDIPFDIEDDGFYGTYKSKHEEEEDNVDPFALPENVLDGLDVGPEFFEIARSLEGKRERAREKARMVGNEEAKGHEMDQG